MQLSTEVAEEEREVTRLKAEVVKAKEMGKNSHAQVSTCDEMGNT